MAALLRRSSRTACQCQRTFSTSTSRGVSLQWEKNDPEALAQVLPEYPYGPTRWYKQSRLGLYGGQRIQFGNNVGKKIEVKTRRTWHPNIFTQKLFSKALNRYVQVRVSARVLRTIDKLGGLDEYLLGEKEARIKELGESGWWLRWAIMQTPTIKKRFAEERRRLGLPENRDEVEAITEALAESGEEVPMETEQVQMDHAFEIEENKDLPPIKFRVGPRQHVMLTPNGWVRTRPNPQYFVEKKKEQLMNNRFFGYVEKRMEAFEAALDARQKTAIESGEVPLSEMEVKILLRSTRKELKAELQEKIERRVELKAESKAKRSAGRMTKKQRRARTHLAQKLKAQGTSLKEVEAARAEKKRALEEEQALESATI